MKITFNEYIDLFSDLEGMSSLSEALKWRYTNLRILRGAGFTDHKKAKIPEGACKEFFDYIDKVYAVATADYKNEVSLLKTVDTEKDGSTNGWYYREFHTVKHNFKNTKGRLSFNIYASPNLIKKLDEILYQDKGENILQYKVPADFNDWFNRVDPITMYFYSLNSELLKQIVTATKPYLREKEPKEIVGKNKVCDINLPPGIYYNKEYSEEDVKNLFAIAEKYFTEFSKEIKECFDPENTNSLSVGQFYVIKKFMIDFAKDFNKIDFHSIKNYINERSNLESGYKIATNKLGNKTRSIVDIFDNQLKGSNES